MNLPGTGGRKFGDFLFWSLTYSLSNQNEIPPRATTGPPTVRAVPNGTPWRFKIASIFHTTSVFKNQKLKKKKRKFITWNHKKKSWWVCIGMEEHVSISTKKDSTFWEIDAYKETDEEEDKSTY